MRKYIYITAFFAVFVAIAVLFAGQVDNLFYNGNTYKFGKIEADTIDISNIDTLGAYADTNTTNALSDTLNMWFAGNDTFGATDTTDTVLISGLSALAPVVITIYGNSDEAYIVSVETTAGTLFVHRAIADTAKSDIYNYIGRK